MKKTCVEITTAIIYYFLDQYKIYDELQTYKFKLNISFEKYEHYRCNKLSLGFSCLVSFIDVQHEFLRKVKKVNPVDRFMVFDNFPDCKY